MIVRVALMTSVIADGIRKIRQDSLRMFETYPHWGDPLKNNTKARPRGQDESKDMQQYF